MSLSLLLAALLSASPAARAEEQPAECPRGTHRIATNDPYDPFKCVKEDPKKGFGAVVGPKGFQVRPKCPHGTRAVETENGLQKFKCVRVVGGGDPELAPIRSDEDAPPPDAATVEDDPMTRGCPPGKRKVRTADPLRPFQCVAQATRVATLSEDSYRRYAIGGELSFDYPKAFQPRDGWKEDVPTVSFTLDDGSPGKPATITVTKVMPTQPTYVDIETAVAKDKDWGGAKDGGTVIVAGLRAKVTFVAGDSKTAYIPFARDSYYAIVYSSPVETYDNYLGAFNRILKTFKLVRRGP